MNGSDPTNRFLLETREQVQGRNDLIHGHSVKAAGHLPATDT
jgi:hypothetical protein